jgi:hypothetical protein
MTQHFYDGQIKRYLTQFMRLMSNFSYMNADGNIIQVPVRYGDITRQVGTILNKNSENIVQSAPFIACFIKDIKFDRSRVQNPTYVNKIHIREREFDSASNEFLNVQGANYTIERLMPTPYIINFTADIWTTNTDQKLQLWEQITVLFNPSMELQTNDNYIDWTSLTVLEIGDGSRFETRTVPQGVNNDLSIASLEFTAPIWITPPAKIKKMGIVTKIINNVFAEEPRTKESGAFDDIFEKAHVFGGQTPDARVTLTHKDFSILVLNNTAALVPRGQENISEGWVDADQIIDRPSWLNLLDIYPGKFISGLSQLRLTKPSGSEIVAFMTLNPQNESIMNLTFDSDTIPQNTIIPDLTNAYVRGTIDAIVNPQTFNPNTQSGQNIDLRYLILDEVTINNTLDGPDAWSSANLIPQLPNGQLASANDIIQWDGDKWNIIFDASETTNTTYITNTYTGIQYKWDGESWTKSFEGIYNNTDWRMIL